MKNTKSVLLSLFLGVLLLVGCGETTADETDTTETNAIVETVETEPATEAETEPILTPANHEITVADVESILVENGLMTTVSQKTPYSAAHGGHQLRVVHTERGTYAAFVKYFDNYWPNESEFYVAKIDNENKVSLLYYGTYYSVETTVLVNIAQDTNGDIYVTTCNSKDLTVYAFDAETDAVTQFTAPTVLASSAEVSSYLYAPEYPQTMFDFANRKIYAFYLGSITGVDFLLEWFTFDMETGTWNDTSIYTIMPELARNNYLYPVPDGNGGAYIVGRRGIDINLISDQLQNTGSDKYARDILRLFYIPDLTSNENIEYLNIQDAYTERGLEGIWNICTSQNGGVFMDADGYLHVTWQNALMDFTGTHKDLDTRWRYYHAIYDGMECIFSEELQLQEPYFDYYKPQIMQSTDGTLYMIAAKQYVEPLAVEIYKANDPLGKTWTLQKTETLDGMYAPSFSMSAVRDGSTQDNTISCFFYGNKEASYSNHSAYTFTISLDDCSVSELVNILENTNVIIDEIEYFKPTYDAHTTKIVHTENGTYAAFLYEYNCNASSESFHIVKIDNDKNVSVLYTGSYYSTQNKYLNMQMLSDGKIYVFLPDGDFICCVDPATDTVTTHEITLNHNAATATSLQQIDVLTDPVKGKTYTISLNGTGVTWTLDHIRIATNSLDLEDMTLSKKAKLILSKVTEGYYTHFYSFSDGDSGAYLVASRNVDPRYISENPNFVGRTDSINDSLVLIRLADLNKNGSPEIIDIQTPYTAEKEEGIWSVVNMADYGDAYMDSEGKLHVIYAMYHFDLDDMDSLSNADLKKNTIKYYHVVYNGMELVSSEELILDGLTENTAVRMAETTDGTLYLIICNIGEAEARIDVYFETESGWALTQTKTLGEFTAESFSISSPRGGSVQDNVIDCIVYANDNDVYFTSVTFETVQ